MQNYPQLDVTIPDDQEQLLRYIVKERKTDVNDFNNLKNVFVLGRKSGKIPLASNDINQDDRVGDMNFDSTYGYVIIDNAGTAEWRRFSLGIW